MIHTAALKTGRFVIRQCLRSVVLHRERADLPCPFIFACTHLSHLEPFILSCLLYRRIDWMARIELFRHPQAAAMLRRLDSFAVNRQGVPVSAIREAIDRLQRGRIVGIFPEGGVQHGAKAVIRGGPMKQGVCVIARRAQAPVVPAVILGTEKLNCVTPWLPIRRGRVWINFGQPIQPVLTGSRRESRRIMAQQIQEGLIATYQELLAACGISDSAVP